MFYLLCFILFNILFRIFFLYRVDGREKLVRYKKNGRPLVICSNHLSALDPVFIIMAWGIGKKLSIMAKAELFRNPILNWMGRHVNAFPVERGKGDRGALEKGIREVREGHGMLIFPEGTRGRSNKMIRMKSGAFLIAGQTGADIIPVRVIYPTKTSHLRVFGRVVVRIGDPIPSEEMHLEEGSRKALREVKARLQNELDRLFDEYNESVGGVLPLYDPTRKTDALPEREPSDERE